MKDNQFVIFQELPKISQTICIYIYRICRRKGRSIFGRENFKKSGCGLYDERVNNFFKNQVKTSTNVHVWDYLRYDNYTTMVQDISTSAASQTLCSCSVRFGRVRQFFTRTWFGSGFGNIIASSVILATAVGTGRAGRPAGPDQHGGLLHTAPTSTNFTLKNCSKRNYL